MTAEEVLVFFKNRLINLEAEKDTAAQDVKILSALRVVLFLAFIILLVYFSNLRLFTASVLLVTLFVILFGISLRFHRRSKFKLGQFKFLIQINLEEIKRFEGDLHDLPNGENHKPKDHAYAPDLDIFGTNSLYQLIVRSRLDGTQKVLNQWMLHGASKAEILERQEAIQELKINTKWRQVMTALGMRNLPKDNASLANLINWLKDQLYTVNKPIWGILSIVMPLFSTVAIIGFWLGNWPYQLLFISLLVNAYIMKVIFVPLMEMTKTFDGIIHLLNGYGRIIYKIENRSFQSPLLKKHAEVLNQKGKKASKALKHLGKIIYFLENRVNLVYQPLNMLFAFDLMIFRSALRWKKNYESKLHAWIDAVHHIDALSDLSSFAYANPSYCVPTISEDGVSISTQKMGHPLIQSSQRVNNDIALNDKGRLALVTGSNMSGKSTFLRTLGINLILTQMGAAACAERFQTSLFRVFTSMRTEDNLEENVSSFYAELSRIKQLLDSLDEDEPVFYMLDEILKGTNSEDRHIGAISLIDQLTHQNCIGLISTHDIQLADLSKDNPNITNFSFNSTIQKDEIIFDYKLTNGPCKSFNASQLMKKMGIIKNTKKSG